MGGTGRAQPYFGSDVFISEISHQRIDSAEFEVSPVDQSDPFGFVFDDGNLAILHLIAEGEHRVRERFVGQRTGIINQIRAFMLERGIAVRQGLRFLRTELPGILATRTDALSPRMLRILEDLSADWRRLDARIEGLSSEIEALARQDKGCERLMTVPGIGPIISSAMVAAIGTGDAFSKGRDFGAWLGLVPKQLSTGDRTILGSISRRGNRYLRKLFVQAAWVVLVKVGPKHWDRYGLKSWIEAAKKRLHHNRS